MANERVCASASACTCGVWCVFADVLLGAAAGSPYIVFILRSLYGFMLRKYIYIYNVDAAVV